MINLETDSLDIIINTRPRVMVMFGTDWCDNCGILKPEFLKVSHQKEYREIPFVFVNPDTSPQSLSLIELTNIPTVVAFKNGKNIEQQFGNKAEVVQIVLNSLL